MARNRNRAVAAFENMPLISEGMTIPQRDLLRDARAHHPMFKTEMRRRGIAAPLFTHERPRRVGRPAMGRRFLYIALAERRAEEITGKEFESRRNFGISRDIAILDPGRCVKRAQQAAVALDFERPDVADGQIEDQVYPLSRNFSKPLAHIIHLG